MADVPGTWLDERVQPKPEPEDAGVASIRARLRRAMEAHEQHPDWPCEDWGCADVDYLLRRLDATAKREGETDA